MNPQNYGELGYNLQKIITRLQSNQNLMKLLYYTDKDPLSQPDLSEEQIKKEIYQKLLKIIPRVDPTETAKSIVAMRVTSGIMNQRNQNFETIIIQFEVFVPLTQWIIKDSNLRPFAIMSEIKQSLNDKKINGLGRMSGGNFSLNFLTDEMSCYEITYRLVEYE